MNLSEEKREERPVRLPFLLRAVLRVLSFELMAPQREPWPEECTIAAFSGPTEPATVVPPPATHTAPEAPPPAEPATEPPGQRPLIRLVAPTHQAASPPPAPPSSAAPAYPPATPRATKKAKGRRRGRWGRVVVVGLTFATIGALLALGGAKGFAAIRAATLPALPNLKTWWTSVNTPDPLVSRVKTVIRRCSGLRELDLALAEIKSLGLERGRLTIQAPALWEPYAGSIAVRIQKFPADEPMALDASPLDSKVLRSTFRFPQLLNDKADSQALVELSVMGEPVPELIGRGDQQKPPHPGALIRARANSRGLLVELEKLSGTQVLPLLADSGANLWEFGIRASGEGPIASLRDFLSDLDSTEWLLHARRVEIFFEDQKAQFSLEGSLLSTGGSRPKN